MIKEEERKLLNEGCSGDIVQKLFTSVKYYISKRPNEKNEPKERRQYVHINKDILSAMNDHIVENKDDENFTPARGYELFISENEREVLIEKNRLITISDLSEKDAELKIKKTYKNRYFILCK